MATHSKWGLPSSFWLIPTILMWQLCWKLLAGKRHAWKTLCERHCHEARPHRRIGAAPRDPRPSPAPQPVGIADGHFHLLSAGHLDFASQITAVACIDFRQHRANDSRARFAGPDGTAVGADWVSARFHCAG